MITLVLIIFYESKFFNKIFVILKFSIFNKFFINFKVSLFFMIKYLMDR